MDVEQPILKCQSTKSKILEIVSPVLRPSLCIPASCPSGALFFISDCHLCFEGNVGFLEETTDNSRSGFLDGVKSLLNCADQLIVMQISLTPLIWLHMEHRF